MHASDVQQLVIDDLAQFEETFEPIGGLERAVTFPKPFEEGFESEGGRFLVAAWQYAGIHRGVFLGFAGTGAAVTIAGVTIIDRETDSYYSTVDWIPVLRQIGVGLYGRPVPVDQLANR